MHFSVYWLLPLGFFIGLFGTLVGAGGGFVLMPLLMFLFPEEPPDHLTGISLAVVFLNALSGSVAYARKRRIDWQATFQFCIAAVPGATLGAWATSYLPRSTFNIIFGSFLTLASLYLFFKSGENKSALAPSGGRKLIEKDGTVHHISYSVPLAMFISFVVGFVSSLIGIGGGIIHVPAMVNALNFPIHIATATSHAVLAVTSFVGLIVHVVGGKMGENLLPILMLSPGVLIGAQLGARLSTAVKGSLILKILALALLSVGLRLIF